MPETSGEIYSGVGAILGSVWAPQGFSAKEVARQTFENKAFTGMPEEQVWDFARVLDTLVPFVKHTETRKNQDAMWRVGERRLLRADFWSALGLEDEIAGRLTEYVAEQIEKRRLNTVRQTESAEFARDQLTADKRAQAQAIRTYCAIASLGMQAKGLGIPPVYQAPFGAQAGLIYGTRVPWTHTEGASSSLRLLMRNTPGTS